MGLLACSIKESAVSEDDSREVVAANDVGTEHLHSVIRLMWGIPQSPCHVTGFVYTSIAMVTMFSCYTEVVS